jgi:hypothetical protein
LEKLEGLRISQEEHHKMQWENRRRTDEISELQNALSETNIALNQERKQVINLSGELETLKCNKIIYTILISI